LIIDRGPQSEDPVRLLGFDRGPKGWLPMVADARGRLDLSPIPLLIGIESDGPRFYDAATGTPIANHTEAKEQSAVAKKQARRAEAKARKEAKARADAEANTRDEAKAREEVEKANEVLAERVRQLEEKLRQLEG